MSHNNEQQIRKAIGIVRRSDIKQKENASLITQKEEILEKAKIEGYTIVDIFEDDGISAYHKSVKERPAMIKALNLALSTTEEIEALFFYEESRLTRQFYDFVLYFYKPVKKEKPHFSFFSTKKEEEWNPDDITSVFEFATAAKESRLKSARIRDAQGKSLRSKKRPASELPFGYKPIINPIDQTRSPASQIIDEETAPIVLFIFYLASWGHSQQKIANLLNEAGIPSPKKTNWSSATIDYILDNDQYLGHLPWNIRTHLNKSRKKERGEYDLLANHHPPIVNVPLWNITHQTIALHKEHGKNNNTPFLLRGLLFCEECNEKLIAKDQTSKHSKTKALKYRCPTCKEKLDVDEIHPVVIQEISSKWKGMLLNMSHNIQQLLSTRIKEITQHRNQLQEQLKQIDYKEQMLKQYLIINNQNGIWDFTLSVSKPVLKKAIHNANQFIEYANLLISNSEDNTLFTLLSNFDINKLEAVEKRTIFLSFFKEIRVDFTKGKHLLVEYQMAPYAELDTYFNSITNRINT